MEGKDMDFGKKLGKCTDFGCIFEIVKDTVEDVLERRRPGLMLALQNLPEHIGALHPVGTNFIVLNKMLLKRVEAFYDRKTTNAYVYYVLLHEYLHTLGYLDEGDVMNLSYHICKASFGLGHEVSKIARAGIGAIIPQIGFHMPDMGIEMEIVERFDMDETSYIG
jgi:hypothetical protein